MSVILVGLGVLALAVLAAIDVLLSRSFYRVLRGDPLDVRWRIEGDEGALVLELSMVGRAEPLVVEELAVDRRLVELLELDSPDGFVRDRGSGDPSGRLVAEGQIVFRGTRSVERGEIAELRFPLGRRLAAEGRIAVSYRYRSILTGMSGLAMARVSVEAES